jgi:hypothetical protein
LDPEEIGREYVEWIQLAGCSLMAGTCMLVDESSSCVLSGNGPPDLIMKFRRFLYPIANPC